MGCACATPILRANFKMRFEKSFFLLTALIAPLTAWAEQTKHLPKDVIERASQYIAGKVGRTYFDKNYRLLTEPSYGNSFEGGTEYFLYFEYLPLSRISGELGSLFVRMFSSPDYVPIDFVASVAPDGTILEPTVTKKEALHLVSENMKISVSKPANAQVVVPNLFNQEKNWSWHVTISLPSNPGCFRTKLYSVDMVTARIEDRGVMSACF